LLGNHVKSRLGHRDRGVEGVAAFLEDFMPHPGVARGWAELTMPRVPWAGEKAS
jgi:hypothetical protein